MPTFSERLTLRDNLYWAWAKAKHLYRCGDIWFDEAEVAHFEANLESEIDTIIKQFSALRYRMSPIRPVAHPKKSKEGGLEPRQAFSIAVRDQVAWIAFVNVVGPNLDSNMPPWSYGNRLFRSVWFEEGPHGEEILRIGWYRHSGGHLYRKFHQAWPVFRRHVYLTIREMASSKVKFALDESDLRVLDAEKSLSSKLKLPYLKRDYWDKPIKTVYWASIDLRKFYPSVTTELILQNLVKYSAFPPNEVKRLAQQLLTFRLDLRGWSTEHLVELGLQDKQRTFPAIPTGLFVSGFLANVALFETDQVISRRLNGRIAHFRYVDDHIILATRFHELVGWLEWYRDVLAALPGDIKFNPEKAHPEELAKLLQARQSGSYGDKSPTNLLFLEAQKKSKLDPKFPTPLMTQTLGLVSDIARTDFDRLDDREQRHILDDLEHLLLTEFPDNEVREDTRIAFAATMISRLAPRSTPNIEPLARLQRKKCALEEQLADLRQPDLPLKLAGEAGSALSEAAQKLAQELKRLNQRIESRQQDFDATSDREHDRVLALLLKALHEHPEKLRLWARVLDYCRRVGYKDLSGLRDELKLHAQANSTTAPYLRALVWQVMADHCFDCAKAIRSDTTSDEWRQASWNYLQAAQKLYTDLRRHEPTRFYEQAAARLLECALGAASILIAHADAPRISSPKDVQAFRTKCRKAGAPAWNAHPETWAAKTRQTLPVWLWWAEAKASRKLSTEPTPIWLCAAEKLDPADPASWTAWARYPRHLSRLVLRHLAHPTSVARQVYLSRNDTGWLYEVLAGLRAKRAALPAPVRSVARNVIKATQVPEGRIALDDWAAWTSSYAENHPHDPRVSEWTALQIVARIALTLSEVTVVAKDYPIHPANFLLPDSWKAEGQELMTWERWRSIIARKVAGKRALVLRRQFRVHDSRFCRVVSRGKLLELQREPVRGLGLLLLGLLRRSFEWPAAWNPSGHQQAWAGIARTLTSTVACSSWTAAIIEACVVPRVRETLLFPVLHNEEATDTQFDPPQIDTISELIQTLNIAAKVLAGYQLSALNHEPRQLVPISLKQLTRPNWLDDFGIASPNAF